MEVKVYSQEGREVKALKVSERLFGSPWKPRFVHQVWLMEEAGRGGGTGQNNDRGAISGGGRNPWRQKGTGRARHGSIRSPLWIGGGVTHGPLKEKSYHKKINKKMAKKALFTALSAKARDNEIIILENLKFPEAKTRHAAELFKNLSHADTLENIVKTRTLLALPEKSK